MSSSVSRLNHIAAPFGARSHLTRKPRDLERQEAEFATHSHSRARACRRARIGTRDKILVVRRILRLGEFFHAPVHTRTRFWRWMFGKFNAVFEVCVSAAACYHHRCWVSRAEKVAPSSKVIFQSLNIVLVFETACLSLLIQIRERWHSLTDLKVGDFRLENIETIPRLKIEVGRSLLSENSDSWLQHQHGEENSANCYSTPHHDRTLTAQRQSY